MVHRNIDDIEIPFFIWKKLVKKDNIKENIAFDTETVDGRAFLIYDSNGNYSNDFNFKNLTGLLTWLNNKSYRPSVNWFYNLEYDTNAILKYLDYEQRQHIAYFNYVDHENFRISIIPRKELKISKVKNNKLSHSTIFYDLAQFYNFQKLATLAQSTIYNKVYVDDISKLDIDKYYSNKEYEKLLNDRCFIDCKIAVIKANELTKNIQKVVNINSYRSNASIARKYVLTNLTHNLKIPSNKLMDMALKAYHAGHIETCQIGLFQNSHNYDIKSAYPFVIADLYETSGGYLHNREYEPDSAYSYYRIDIDYENDYLSPLWYLKLSGNYHINGKIETLVSKSEFEYLFNMGYTIKIKEAHHLTKDKYTEQPFYDIIHNLYNERLKAKNADDPYEREIELVFKIILNSIYGVTLNTINKKILSDYETDLYQVIGNNVYFYQSKFKATNMYNPVYGNDIPARTRSKIFEDFKNKFNKIISINTDGVFMVDKCNHLNISSKLGDYGYKKLDKIMVMGSGRYFISNNDIIDDKESKFRGIAKSPKDIYNDMIKNKHANKLITIKEKPIKLKESLKNTNYYNFKVSSFPIQDFYLNDQFNVFNKVEKDVYFKTDKRYWYDEIKIINDLWDDPVQSRPFNINELK